MNAQYHIATTPKYNFPLQEENLRLPQQFAELSLLSLEKAQQLKSGFSGRRSAIESSMLDLPRRVFHATRMVKLEPNPVQTPIVGIDVSSIRFGETKKGILIAVRSAIVWRKTNQYRYLRLGPFPFHITEKNKKEICNLLSEHLESTHIREASLPPFPYMQTRLAKLLEQWTQTFVNRTTRDSVILWDGSLTAGTPDTPIQTMEQLLKEARGNGNTVLAFSKMTRLLLYGYRITDLLWKRAPPCLLEIKNHYVQAASMKLLGKIFVAKLDEGSCTFRLDIDRELHYDQSIESVRRLLGNDLVLQGYPETLRLAHIFSTFTANEVIGMQRCITQGSNLKIIVRPNVRRILFGRFGKGPEG